MDSVSSFLGGGGREPAISTSTSGFGSPRSDLKIYSRRSEAPPFRISMEFLRFQGPRPAGGREIGVFRALPSRGRVTERPRDPLGWTLCVLAVVKGKKGKLK